MPEYTYLLDTRLTPAQGNALKHVRDAVREAGMTVFLAGGAVRDLTTGSSVRDLDFSVQGNALELQDALQARGAVLWGLHEPSRTLHLWFPGSVRVEVSSTRSESYPKPGQPVYSPSSIVEDLRRRDFTANAMALSLNDGSYGLLLDPLNGVADIEARQLRLANNYGFLEDPARLVRAVRLRQRLGWQWEERTATRYENAKEAAGFEVLSAFQRGYELEEIAAEEDALPVLEALEAEGWLQQLFAGWTLDSVDRAALTDLHASRIELLMQGIAPDLTAAHLEVLTAKMPAEDRERFKATLSRAGLRAQWEGLEAASREFGKQLTGKDAAQPSATWKLFHAAEAEPILWLAHGRKTPAVEGKFKNLFTVWPEIAKQVPAATMLEMRITPELPAYSELLHALFLKQIDGELGTDEAMRAFLEPYSPPAPPPPVTLRRTRAKKADGKGKRKGSERDDEDDDEDEDENDAPVRTRREDDDEDVEDAEEDEPSDDVSDELAALPEPGTPDTLNPKVNFDSIDLHAVLGRIASDDDDGEGEEAADAAEPDAGAGELDAPVVRGGALAKTVAAKTVSTRSSAAKVSKVGPSEAETAPAAAKPIVVSGQESKKARKAAPAAVAPTAGKEKAGAAKSSAEALDTGADEGPRAQAAPAREAGKTAQVKAAPPKPPAAPSKATAAAKSASPKAPGTGASAKKPEASASKDAGVPAKSAPAKTVSAKAVPARTAPPKVVPGKAAPAKAAPAKPATGKAVPATSAPSEGKKTAPPAARPAKSSAPLPSKKAAAKAAAPARRR